MRVVVFIYANRKHCEGNLGLEDDSAESHLKYAEHAWAIGQGVASRVIGAPAQASAALPLLSPLSSTTSPPVCLFLSA